MPAKRSPSLARHESGDVLVLVGTTKGAFIVSSDASRKKWKVEGPHFPGEAVYSMAYDQRAGRTRLLVGVHSNHWGATVRLSDDFGRTWTGPDRQAVRFPESSGHVNVFVGDESVAFLDGLDTPVAEGATITIVPAVSGG